MREHVEHLLDSPLDDIQDRSPLDAALSVDLAPDHAHRPDPTLPLPNGGSCDVPQSPPGLQTEPVLQPLDILGDFGQVVIELMTAALELANRRQREPFRV